MQIYMDLLMAVSVSMIARSRASALLHVSRRVRALQTNVAASHPPAAVGTGGDGLDEGEDSDGYAGSDGSSR